MKTIIGKKAMAVLLILVFAAAFLPAHNSGTEVFAAGYDLMHLEGYSGNYALSFDLYNGDPERVKAVPQNTASTNTEDANGGAITGNFIMTEDGKHRIVEYRDIVYEQRSLYNGGKYYTIYFPLSTMRRRGKGTGLHEGPVKVKVYYDYNGDGDHNDAGEYIGEMKHNMEKDESVVKAYNFAKNAVAHYGTDSYDLDMRAIMKYSDYCKNHPDLVDDVVEVRGGLRYINGELENCDFYALMFSIWSAEKYGVYGIIRSMGDAGHVGFFPERNDYTTQVSFDYG